MTKDIQIGSFKNQFLIEDFTDKFFNWMNTEMVLWFFWCMYDTKEISDKFTNADGILKKREMQMRFIEIMSQDSELYSVDEILSLIRTTITKLYTNLNTIGKFKSEVEAGHFSGWDDDHIYKRAIAFADDYFYHRPPLTSRRWLISIRDGSPLINQYGGEWQPIIHPDKYDPTNPNSDYKVDIFGYMVDNSAMYYVDKNGNRVSTPILAPGYATRRDPIGDPAIEANRLAWNKSMRNKGMYGDFNIDEYGYMVSQINNTVYVNAFGAKVSAKQLVDGLIAPLDPTKNNPGFSLSSVGLPVIILAGSLLISLVNKKKTNKENKSKQKNN